MTNECYICFENCNEKSSCDCKELYVHKKCQLNYIIKNKTENCPVCNKNYNNLSKKEIITNYYTTEFYFLIVLYIILFLVNSLSIYYLYMYIYNISIIKTLNNFYIIPSVIFFTISTFLSIFTFIYRENLKYTDRFFPKENKIIKIIIL